MSGTRTRTKAEHVAAAKPAAIETNEVSDAATIQWPEGEVVKLAPPQSEPLIHLRLPFGDVDPKLHLKRHVDLQLSKRQAQALAQILEALRGEPYELTIDGTEFRRDGRLIDNPAKVFYWLLNGASLLIAAHRAAAETSGASDA